MLSPRWSKQLDLRAFLVFQRLHRFYKTLIVLAALVSGLATGALTFDEFHSADSTVMHASEGLLCSSAITAVVSAVIATMLLFLLEDLGAAVKRDLVLAWSPLVLLDISIVEFLIGMVCWYTGKNKRWRGALMVTHFSVLIGCCLVLSI